MKEPAKYLRVLGLLFLLAAVVEMGWLHGMLPLENRLSDFLVRHHARNLSPDPDIVLVNIDDASLAQMENIAGSWPWPRSVHGELVEGISRQQPKAIVFDLPFVERDVYRPESDAQFNQALQGKQNIYFPLVRLPKEQDGAGPLLAQVAGQLGIRHSAGANPDAHAALMPPLAVNPQFWRTGTINFANDSDGVGRRYDLYTDIQGWLLPSLPARIAQDLGYPVPQQADMLLSWRGGSRAFTRIPYAELYQDFNREHPLRRADELRGKIVIIGTDASALHDIRVTPIASLYPGQAILATAIDNLKNQRMMHRPPRWLGMAVCLDLLAALYAQLSRRRYVLRTGLALFLLSLSGLAASYLALDSLLVLQLLTPLTLAWAFYILCALQEYLRERKSRQQAVQLFSRFVNPHVVKELVASGGLSRAGESRQITVLFSDIRGFTGLAENRTPQEVVSLLNRYFSLQVEVIFRHGGSLDKFIGDCIMAFWGAPLDDEQHALNAVQAALEMSRVLQQFKQELGEQDKDFDVGIGLHSGPAVVGLIGSEQRREYTAIGDTVNLASRIEGLTKEVAGILLSRETMLLCGGALDFALAGSYKVKGREQEVELYTPTEKSER
ncbi:adenylate/guanylate cyclase domain-containing protein [Undibacterium terreum]|uniref:Guanylate cyclase domain-containing protein n=1 Tax=Undibacterium terreum TaxID=1224302 RepID=A0A916UUW7_9BURK|nr:adenylate/guanylate cyclase domain-containing protein [Undibacterium terreum]GGC89569.1 hypothetical protein GCM10011396_40980 [Undibacterium terreum]